MLRSGSFFNYKSTALCDASRVFHFLQPSTAASHSRKFTCLGKSNSTKAYLMRGSSRFHLHWEFPVTLASTRLFKQSSQISLTKTFRKHSTPMEAPYFFLDYQFKRQNNFQGSPPHFGSRPTKPLAESYAARMWLNMSRWQMSTMSLEIVLTVYADLLLAIAYTLTTNLGCLLISRPTFSFVASHNRTVGARHRLITP